MATSEHILQQVQRDLQIARDKVADTEQQLTRARAELADLEGFVRTFERYSLRVDGPREARERGKNKDRGVAARGTQARQLVDTCIDAIREAGHPVRIGDLLETVLATGLTLGGNDQKSNLAGYLSRDPRVHSLGRFVGWDIVETEGAASEPGSNDAAPSQDQGGTDDGPTLTDRDLADLMS